MTHREEHTYLIITSNLAGHLNAPDRYLTEYDQVLYMIPYATASSFYRSFTPRICHLHCFPFTDNEKGREVRYKRVLVSVLPDSLIPSLKSSHYCLIQIALTSQGSTTGENRLPNVLSSHSGLLVHIFLHGFPQRQTLKTKT